MQTVFQMIAEIEAARYEYAQNCLLQAALTDRENLNVAANFLISAEADLSLARTLADFEAGGIKGPCALEDFEFEGFDS